MLNMMTKSLMKVKLLKLFKMQDMMLKFKMKK